MPGIDSSQEKSLTSQEKVEDYIKQNIGFVKIFPSELENIAKEYCIK